MVENELALQRLEEERDSLRRELRGVQEMLAFILFEVGEPVVVTKETLARGLPDGALIKVDEDLMTDSFVFSLEANVSE